MSSFQAVLTWIQGKTCISCGEAPATNFKLWINGSNVYAVPSCNNPLCVYNIVTNTGGILDTALGQGELLLITDNSLISAAAVIQNLKGGDAPIIVL